MSVVKVIEVLAESYESWEDATKLAVKEAAKTVHNIESVYVKHLKAIVKDGEVEKYRVNAKVSFIVD